MKDKKNYELTNNNYENENNEFDESNRFHTIWSLILLSFIPITYLCSHSQWIVDFFTVAESSHGHPFFIFSYFLAFLTVIIGLISRKNLGYKTNLLDIICMLLRSVFAGLVFLFFISSFASLVIELADPFNVFPFMCYLWTWYWYTGFLICFGVAIFRMDFLFVGTDNDKNLKSNELVSSSCGQKSEEKEVSCFSCGVKQKDGNTCSNCGHEVEKEDNYCSVCGTKQKDDNTCSNCGHEIDKGGNYCSVCGAKQ